MRAHRRCTALVSVALVLGASACGGAGGDGGGERGKEVEPVCAVVEIAQRRILGPADRSFRSLVDDRSWDRDARDAAAAVRFLHGSRTVGRYEPLADHLDERSAALDGRTSPPKPTAEVRALATELDRLIARGGCER